MAAADSVTTTAGLLQVLIHSPSERFLERPQIDFVRPGAASLAMNLQVRFGNGFNIKHHDCSAFSHRPYRNVTSPLRPVYCASRFATMISLAGFGRYSEIARSDGAQLVAQGQC